MHLLSTLDGGNRAMEAADHLTNRQILNRSCCK
nr:MAG TPA: hypothetical protein [Caudoviricetes sp.]